MKQILKNYAKMRRAEDRLYDDMQRVALQIATGFGSNDVTVLGLRIIVDEDSVNTKEPGLFHPDDVWNLMCRLLNIGRGMLVTGACVEDWSTRETPFDYDDDVQEEELDTMRDAMTDGDNSIHSYAVTLDEWMKYQKFILTEQDRRELFSDVDGEYLTPEEADDLDAMAVVRVLMQWAVPIGSRLVWFYSTYDEEDEQRDFRDIIASGKWSKD